MKHPLAHSEGACINHGSYKGREKVRFRPESKNKPIKMGREALKGEDGLSMLCLTSHRGKTSGARQGITEKGRQLGKREASKFGKMDELL